MGVGRPRNDVLDSEDGVAYMFVKKRHRVDQSVIGIKPQIVNDKENREKKPIAKISQLVDNRQSSVGK